MCISACVRAYVLRSSVDAVRIASDLEEGEEQAHDPAALVWKHFIYGEILPSSVAAMLRQLDASAGDRYYDLGSGDGKTAAVAWHAGLHAVGIELVEHRFNASCRAVAALREAWSARGEDSGGPAQAVAEPAARGSLRLLRGSFLDLDWSAADIIFVASVTFSDALMEKLAMRARRLRRGAKIVSWRPFPGADFAPRGVVRLSATWQLTEEESLPFSLQEKVTEAELMDESSSPAVGGVSADSAEDAGERNKADAARSDAEERSSSGNRTQPLAMCEL